MIRIALVYVAIAVLGLFWVTGFPFGLSDKDAPAVQLADTQPQAPVNPEAAAPAEVTLEVLVASALAVGQTPEQIDQLINQAASHGNVRVPTMLLTTEGRVDTPVLMASMEQLAKVPVTEQGDVSSDDSYITPETAILDIQDLSYLVQPGDSLGGLALKFYGNAAQFAPIYDANRQILATPTSIRVGQVLTIPARSKL